MFLEEEEEEGNEEEGKKEEDEWENQHTTTLSCIYFMLQSDNSFTRLMEISLSGIHPS